MTILTSRTETALGGLEAMTGEAVWATMQTVQVAASVELEWWCVAHVSADTNISTAQNDANHFQLGRILISIPIC